MKTVFKFSIIILCLILNNDTLKAQCANSSNIYSFIYNGHSYEVIKEKKSWINAAACAVERGGWLAEINDSLEQDAVFTELNTNSGISLSSSIAPDGGGGAYVWLGGNDLITEGNWVWDGNNDSTSTQFWMGTSTGNPVGGLFNNWGNEPDDFGNGQDALGLSLNGWPLGVAGQWNDVNHSNLLYFIVEYSGVLKINDDELSDIKIYPNPVNDFLTIENTNLNFKDAAVTNMVGQEIKQIQFNDSKLIKVNMQDMNNGIYFIKINTKDGRSITKKIVK